jgi:hypothetical protein
VLTFQFNALVISFIFGVLLEPLFFGSLHQSLLLLASCHKPSTAMAVYGALQTFLPNSSLQVFVTVAVPLIFCIYYLSSRTSFPPKAPRVAHHNYPIVGALGFFTERWTFCQRAIADSPTGNFSFHLGKHPIIGVSGEEGRKVFFDNRQLSLAEGYV